MSESGGTSSRCEGNEGWIGIPARRAPLHASSDAILQTVTGPDELHLFICPEGEHRNFLNCVKSRRDPISVWKKDIGCRPFVIWGTSLRS